jgi:hypothetical protein
MSDSYLLQNLVRVTKISDASLTIRNTIWYLGNIAWIFGIIDRSIAIFAEGGLSFITITELLVALFLFVCWLFLKPHRKTTSQKPQNFALRPFSVKGKEEKEFKVN